MSKGFFNAPKGEGERIALKLQPLGLTFAPNQLVGEENNMQYNVQHVIDLCNHEEPKWLAYEEIVDRKPHPDDADAGKHREILVGRKKMDMIVPDVTEGLHQSNFFPTQVTDVHEQEIVSRPKYDFTVLSVKGYTKHLTCSVYIQEVKKQVIGKIVKLRTAIMQAVLFYAPRYKYVPEVYTSQYRFASENMTQLVLGINEFDDLPIDAMNETTLFTYVKGVNTLEIATMVKKVATTSSFQVKVRNYPEKKNFSVDCVFDDDENQIYRFGKGRIKTFDTVVNEVDEDGHAPFTLLCSEHENELIRRKKRQKRQKRNKIEVDTSSK